MIFWRFLFVCYFFPSIVLAQFDANLSAGFRSYPSGGGVSLQSGYNHIVWGDQKSQDYKFGLVRPGIELGTAGSYNSGAGFVEFYPIGFLGIKVTQERNSNSKDYDTFNCEFVDCSGGRQKNSIEFKMGFQFQKYFGVYREKMEWHERQGWDPRRFVEPTYGLLLDSSGHDRISISQVVIGAKLDEKNNFLVGVSSAEARETSMKSHQTFFGFSHGEGDYSFFGGFGYWKSDAKLDADKNILLQASWTPIKSWALF